MKVILSALFVLSSITNLWALDCHEDSVSLGGSEFQVHIKSFLREKSDRHLLIIPPTGGTNFLDRSWARNFCAAGFNAHIVEHWTDDDEYSIDLGIHQRFYSRTQRAIGVVLEHVKGAKFVGMLGTSIGGIHTAMAMGIHDRIDAAFVITAGADMPSIIANSEQDAMVMAWNKRKELLKIPDKATYMNMLREKIEYEPLRLPRKFEGKNLGMIIGDSDTVVPYANQIKLKEHWKPQTVMNYSFNHFWTIVWSWLWDSSKIIDFFQASADSKKV